MREAVRTRNMVNFDSQQAQHEARAEILQGVQDALDNRPPGD